MSHDGTNGASQADTDPQMLHRVYRRPVSDEERREIAAEAFERGRVQGQTTSRAEALPRIAAVLEGYAKPALGMQFISCMCALTIAACMGWFAMRAREHDRAMPASVTAPTVQAR